MIVGTFLPLQMLVIFAIRSEIFTAIPLRMPQMQSLIRRTQVDQATIQRLISGAPQAARGRRMRPSGSRTGSALLGSAGASPATFGALAESFLATVPTGEPKGS